MAGARDYRITLAWETAALSRQKRLPRLSTLLTNPAAHHRDMMELRSMLTTMGQKESHG